MIFTDIDNGDVDIDLNLVDFAEQVRENLVAVYVRKPGRAELYRHWIIGQLEDLQRLCGCVFVGKSEDFIPRMSLLDASPLRLSWWFPYSV